MKAIIDRFEGEMAAIEIENNNFEKMPKILLSGAKEGDCIEITPAKTAHFYVASIDEGVMFVVTPNGKYAMNAALGGGAKAGDGLVIKINKTITQQKENKIKGLMNSLFT